jgi:hypothetical protein
MTGQDFERKIVHAFNDYQDAYGKKLIAYRHFQMRFQPQLFDVLVDSRFNEFYLAIECKSVNYKQTQGLYFKQHFSWKDGVCQVEREDRWLNLSGRNGILAVEVRGGVGARNRVFFVPWITVIHNFNAGYVGIPADVITGCPVARSAGGKYLIDDDLMEEIIERCISYPRSKSRAKKSHRWNKED